MWSFGDFLGLQEIPEKCLTTSESTEVSENTWKRCFWIEKKSFFVYARNQTSSSSYHWSKGQHLTTWAIRPSHGIMIIIAYLKTNGLEKVTSAASSLYMLDVYEYYVPCTRQYAPVRAMYWTLNRLKHYLLEHGTNLNLQWNLNTLFLASNEGTRNVDHSFIHHYWNKKKTMTTIFTLDDNCSSDFWTSENEIEHHWLIKQ